MTKIVFLNDQIKFLSLGKKLFYYLSYNTNYHILFTYISEGSERVCCVEKSQYDILVDMMPNLSFPINSDNILQIMTHMNIKFVSDINCVFFLVEEEELLYARFKNEEIYLNLINGCEDFSGNILDYIKKH